MSFAIAYRARPAAGARTCFRPHCRPAAAACRDWLLPDKIAKGVPGHNAPHSREEGDHHADTPQPEPPQASGLPPALLAILSEQDNRDPRSVSQDRRKQSEQERPKPRPWEMKMSDVEWVFLNELYPQYPEVWQYIFDRAMLRRGITPEPPISGPPR